MEDLPRADLKTLAGASTIYKDVAQLDPVQEEIRVIHLEGGVDNSPIKCTLHKVELNSTPTPIYDALSYTWGDATDTREIILNGYVVDITFNLFQALRRLRQGGDKQIIWVDAVCINQLDLDERSQQVGLMRKVYSLCVQAVIWLGEPPDQATPTFVTHWFGDERDDENIDWLWDNFYDYATDPDLDSLDEQTVDWSFHGLAMLRLLTSGHLSEHPLFVKMVGDDFEYPLGYSGYCKSITRTLEPFVRSPWWTRVWTVQECILPRNAILLYGPVSVDFLFLIKAFSALSHHMLSDCCSHYFSRSDPAVRMWIRDLGSELRNIEILRTNQQNGTKTELWDTLLTFRMRKATDDRDKVFGVLGLIDSWPGAPVVADYRTTAEMVYRQIVISSSKETSSLLPLHFPLMKSNHPDLPSWVVDWTTPGGLGSQVNTYQFSHGIYRVFKAGRNQNYHFIPSSDGKVIEVKGRHCDRVAVISTTVPEGTASGKRNAYCDWFKLAGLDQDPSRKYITGVSFFEAFWRCLCWNVLLTISDDKQPNFNSKASDEVLYEGFLSYCLSSPKSLFHPNGLSKEEREAVVRLDPKFTPAEDHKWGIFSTSGYLAEQIINGLTVNTKMFMTEQGYLGVGPPDTQVGDEVKCLFGGWMPFILRSTGKTGEFAAEKTKVPTWKVLGTCYLHGIMDGEIADNEDLPIETLHLA
ncbi:heterokaryon incompatibility protein-domain-containing protein [Fusarium tricinctum]|uniref:Heterokaryon incompatibility protein-domain-containing protein n=1 Tax=Fusarium tricinctum TaxID=61284 RepID=A0A8K0W860_9HYPO|nr:heterokaryon incompatibility protein-domain-containing protein [Fusarium tricinctum]